MQNLSPSFSNSKNALIVTAGGGNDSVTALAMLAQLKQKHHLSPVNLYVSCMMPVGVTYHNFGLTDWDRFHTYHVTPESQRQIIGRPISMPDVILAKHKDEFNIKSVLGFHLHFGSEGLANSLVLTIDALSIDTLVLLDVGGDILATKDNVAHVLSPMMDAYALCAVETVNNLRPDVRTCCVVLGLGTDGETPPKMLAKELRGIEYYSNFFDKSDALTRAMDFYHARVEKERYSRTADMTFRGMQAHWGDADDIQSPIVYRHRYVTRPEGTPIKHYAEFNHDLDTGYQGMYVITDHLSAIDNPFSVCSNNCLGWLIRTTDRLCIKFCHELSGQTLSTSDMDDERFDCYVGTIPWRFTGDMRSQIATDITTGVKNKVYGATIMYLDDAYIGGVDYLLNIIPLTDSLAWVVRRDSELAL